MIRQRKSVRARQRNSDRATKKVRTGTQGLVPCSSTLVLQHFFTGAAELFGELFCHILRPGAAEERLDPLDVSNLPQGFALQAQILQVHQAKLTLLWRW